MTDSYFDPFCLGLPQFLINRLLIEKKHGKTGFDENDGIRVFSFVDTSFAVTLLAGVSARQP